MVRLRKYCTIHDSLWWFGEVCDSKFIADEGYGGIENSEQECKFITVDLVNKPTWVKHGAPPDPRYGDD